MTHHVQVKLNDDQYRALKLHVAERNSTIQEVLSVAIEHYLNNMNRPHEEQLRAAADRMMGSLSHLKRPGESIVEQLIEDRRREAEMEDLE